MTQKTRAAVLLSALVVLGLAGCQSVDPSLLKSYAPTLEGTASPTGLRAQFFGTSTLLISDGATSIMVDGFFSRPSWSDLISGRTQPNQNRIRDALVAGGVNKVDVLLVSHSHHDHAMDAPIVANKYNALVVGSESTRNIARGLDFHNLRWHPIKDRGHHHEGDFKINFLEVPHAPHIRPLEWMLEGHIDKPLRPPAGFSKYKLGGNYAFWLEHKAGNILILPSAGPPLELKKTGGVQADVVFLSIGNMNRLSNAEIKTYWKEAVVETGAKVVIPIHWDDFTSPLVEPLAPTPYPLDKVLCAMETLTYLAKGRPVRFMPLFQPVLISGLDERLPKPDPQGAAGQPDPFKHGCRKGRK